MLLAAVTKSISEMTSTSKLVQVLPASTVGKVMAAKGLMIFLVAVEMATEEAEVL